MSPLAWLALAAVIAIGLDYLWIRYRRRRVAPETFPSVEPEPASEPGATPAPEPDRALAAAPVTIASEQRFALWGILGVAIGIVAQFLLANGQAIIAAVGYVIAIILVVRSLRATMPEKPPEEVDGAGPAAGPVAPKPEALVPAQVPTAARTVLSSINYKLPPIWRTWRYYTLSNLLHRTPPDIPESLLEPPAPEPPPPAEVVEPVTAVEASVPAAVAPPVEAPQPIQPPQRVEVLQPVEPPNVSAPGVASPTEPRAAPPKVETPPPSAPVAPSQPARPQPGGRVMAISPVGEVVVIDIGRRHILRFDRQGKLLKRVEEVDLPASLNANDLIFSPEGDIVFVFNAAGDTLQSINLA